MKARLTMRTVLAVGLPSALARGVGRVRQVHRVLLARAVHETGRGNFVTTAVLVAVYIAA